MFVLLLYAYFMVIPKYGHDITQKKLFLFFYTGRLFKPAAW